MQIKTTARTIFMFYRNKDAKYDAKYRHELLLQNEYKNIETKKVRKYKYKKNASVSLQTHLYFECLVFSLY